MSHDGEDFGYGSEIGTPATELQATIDMTVLDEWVAATERVLAATGRGEGGAHWYFRNAQVYMMLSQAKIMRREMREAIDLYHEQDSGPDPAG
jgi:hypothetical protein